MRDPVAAFKDLLARYDAAMTKKNVQSAPVVGVGGEMKDKTFRQPRGEFTVYDTASQKQPDQSTPLKREMVAFENRIRTLSIESGAFFDVHGRLLVQTTGTEKDLDFTDDALELGRFGYFTHNHPNGGTFSERDIQTASKLNLQQVSAVTPVLRYRMSKAGGQWPSRPALRRSLDMLDGKANDIVKEMIRIGDLPHRYANDEINHQLWVLVAREFGLVYCRERS